MNELRGDAWKETEASQAEEASKKDAPLDQDATSAQEAGQPPHGPAAPGAELPAPQNEEDPTVFQQTDPWDEPGDPLDWELGPPPVAPNLGARRRGTRGTMAKLPARPQLPLSPTQKLLLLDTWQRSGLPARDFAALVNLSRHTLLAWKRRFEQLGPAGLLDQPRGPKAGCRLPEVTKRTILMLKQAHPEWGCQRISDLLLRGPALPASPAAVARILHEAGYEAEQIPTKPHGNPVHSFERARPNQLWQTDLFTFMLKRQNRQGDDRAIGQRLAQAEASQRPTRWQAG